MTTEVVLPQRPYIYPSCVSLPSVKFHQFNECTNSILVPVFHRWTTPDANQRLQFKWTRSHESRPRRKRRAFYRIASGSSSEWNLTVIDWFRIAADAYTLINLSQFRATWHIDWFFDYLKMLLQLRKLITWNFIIFFICWLKIFGTKDVGAKLHTIIQYTQQCRY
jgi:hypothetical protein